MNFNFNLTDFFKLPTQIMLAIVFASGMILFLPDYLAIKIYILDFRNKYGFIIGVIFLISFSITIVSILVIMYKFFSHKYYSKKFKSGAKNRLKKLSDYQKAIVYSLYIEDDHTQELPYNNGAVRLLKNNMIIIETTNQYIVSDLNNAVLPYMLESWVVEELQENNNLTDEFSESFEQMKLKYS